MAVSLGFIEKVILSVTGVMDNISVDNAVAVIYTVTRRITEDIIELIISVRIEKVGGLKVNDVEPARSITGQGKVNHISTSVPENLRCPYG